MPPPICGVYSTFIWSILSAPHDARWPSSGLELKFVSLLRVALLNAIYEIPLVPHVPPPGPVLAPTFPYARRRDYDEKRLVNAYRRCSSDVHESALSSWHTARDRAMTCTIARTLAGGTEQNWAVRPTVKTRIESAFIWRACTHIYAEKKRERERQTERSDHHCSRGMRTSRGKIGDYVRLRLHLNVRHCWNWSAVTPDFGTCLISLFGAAHPYIASISLGIKGRSRTMVTRRTGKRFRRKPAEDRTRERERERERERNIYIAGIWSFTSNTKPTDLSENEECSN